MEKIIGKVKAEKYGRKILDEIENYETKNEIDEEPSGGAGKNKKALVLIESSEDEAFL